MTSDEPATLRVVRGDATPEELAALLVVLQAVAPAASDAAGPAQRVGRAPPPRARTPDGRTRRLARERPAGLTRSTGVPLLLRHTG